MTIIIAITAVSLVALCVWMRYRWFLYCGNTRRDIPVTFKRFAISLYSLLLFIIMVYGIALPYTVLLYMTVWNKERRLMIFHKFLQLSSRLIIRLMPEIYYTFNNSIGETFERPGVIISNHQGHFDLMCIMMMTPRLVVLTNQWVWRNPLYGWIIRVAQFYPVSNGLDYNIPKLKSLIDRGYSVVIFPEGTRSADCRILRFHTGAFYLAEKLGVDIIPVILHGVGHCIPKTDFMLRPGKMYLEVMGRVKVQASDDEMYLRKLSRQVRNLYLDRYEELRQDRETAGYYSPYVKSKYLYMPHGAYRSVHKLLNDNNNYTSTVDIQYTSGSTVIVHDTSSGALSWLLSLVHPDITVVAKIDNHMELETASHTPGIPSSRLIFSDMNSTIKGDYLIDMSHNGRVNNIATTDK
ncbi:MAG: 1-acyl-sn-glycerol-3-phosphate acyltransferase [Muribaculaceae bacterium]|nr:1-acyl-sn-glycerol-3-phosphate acyltransferase [Muribaculaceae bacterium]